MSALKLGDQISLVFTKVMDVLSLGLDDEGEETQAVTDRNFWETQRGTKETVALADEMLDLIKTFAPGMELKYNKFYIGLAKDGQSNNFAVFRPKKGSFRAEIHIKPSPEVDRKLDEAGIDVMDYDKRWGYYRLRLTKAEIQKHKELLHLLLKKSYGMEVDLGLTPKV
jgi:hypothetical protein